MFIHTFMKLQPQDIKKLPISFNTEHVILMVSENDFQTTITFINGVQCRAEIGYTDLISRIEADKKLSALAARYDGTNEIKPCLFMKSGNCETPEACLYECTIARGIRMDAETIKSNEKSE